MKEKRMKQMALVGLIGGLLFAIGDVFTYLLPNYHDGAKIYTDWAGMDMSRLTASLYLGCLGCGLLLVGFYSLYSSMKEKCSKLTKAISILIASGIVLTPIGHFCIACIVPMTYKVSQTAGATDEVAKTIALSWDTYMNPLKGFIILTVILIQSLLMIVLIVKRKLNCPKWMVILNPLAFTILSIPLSILLNGTGFEGLTEALESLGEGCMYIAVYYHWKTLIKG